MCVRRQGICGAIFSHLIFDDLSLGGCVCLLRVRGWVGDLMLSDICEASCVHARVCVCVCVCVCAYIYIYIFGSLNLTLNPTLLTYPLTLTTTVFQPQFKTELQDAVQACGVDPMDMRK